MINEAKLDSLVSWLMAGAQPPKSVDAIVEEVARRLIDIGVPVDIFILNGLFIHPHTRGIQIRWSANRGVHRETFTHDFMESIGFAETEINKCITDRRAAHIRVDPDKPEDLSSYLRSFARAGYLGTYLMPLFNFDGTVTGALEVATRDPQGFTDEHIQALRRVQAPIARMKEYFTEHFDKQITLATYVGEATSRRVLAGQILLGRGETISAVVLFADIVGFTRLSNHAPSEDVLNTLNTFFAALDEAVGRNSGEILKFMGDGALAIFQTPDDLTAQEAAASSAVEAVAQTRAALSRSGVVDFRAALHIGDVFYGNIGSGNRLDFTAIGPTVNLASRMLGEAGARGARTVCSPEFQRLAIGLEAEALDCELAGFDSRQKMVVID